VNVVAKQTGVIMDFSEAASAAIETWAARNRPDVTGLRWVSKIPAQDWQYSEFSWTRQISEIHREFERRVGFAIPLSPAEKRKTIGFNLLKTHFILVRKAETQSGRTLLKALLSA